MSRFFDSLGEFEWLIVHKVMIGVTGFTTVILLFILANL